MLNLLNTFSINKRKYFSWYKEHNVNIMNVAKPKESEYKNYNISKDFLGKLLIQ